MSTCIRANYTRAIKHTHTHTHSLSLSLFLSFFLSFFVHRLPKAYIMPTMKALVPAQNKERDV